MANEQPRDSHGRFAGGAEAATRANGRYPVTDHNGERSVASHIFAEFRAGIRQENYTIGPRGQIPTNGYQVGGGGKFIGGWTDPATGKRYVERSTNVRNKGEAVSLGQKRNQISIFDHKAGRTIATGGTGG